jgi:hypothetical protein
MYNLGKAVVFICRIYFNHEYEKIGIPYLLNVLCPPGKWANPEIAAKPGV